MGVDKAHVSVATKTMLDHVVSALVAISDEVVVVGRSESLPGVRTLPDSGSPHRGPLAGILAAVEAFPETLLAVVAVDQPWVRVETLEHLVKLAGRLPVVPVDDGIRQTTCAVYPTDALEGIRDELEGGGSIQSLLDRTSFRPVIDTEWQSWDEDGRSWFSADSTTDIEEGLERFGPP
jgi:molybdopterin-guanine dinucleotide biosynthesis protein A